jgi:hypothetical protein
VGSSTGLDAAKMRKRLVPAGENEREKENINMQDEIIQAAFELIRLNTQ